MAISSLMPGSRSPVSYRLMVFWFVFRSMASYSITIEAVDENGKRIQDDTVYVNDLNAGQEQDFEAFTLITSDDAKKLKTAKFNILEVSKF